MSPLSHGELVQMEASAKSPVEIIFAEQKEIFENGIIRVVQDSKIKVNKPELIRALELDKELREGKLVEVVRCRDCEYWDPGSPMATVIPTPCRCRVRREDYGMTAEDFCSYGRRKEKTDEC